MSRKPEQDGWLGSTLRQSPAAATDACLDAETLAAWADGGLTTQAAAAVDLHASTCSRCMAVLGAMERSAPPAPAPHAWTPARLFRWLVPLTAAATAIAIWVAVPDRPITPQQTAAVQDLGTTSERADSASQVPVPVPVPVPERGTQNQRQNQNAAPSTQNPEPLSSLSKSPPAQEEMRGDSRRERGTAESLDAAAGAAPVVEAPLPAAPPAAAAPSSAARSATSTDALAETTTATQRSAFSAAAPPMEFAAPSNALVRWRVIGPASIERTTDGGRTWTSATPLPGAASDKPAGLSVVTLRVVDAERAVVRTSDGRESYTTNGGRSWTLVQENSKAPF